MKKQSLPVNDRRASPNSWRLLTIRLPLAHEEAASVLLFELGSTGIVTLAETNEIVELGAYFENHIQVDEITTGIEELFAGLDSIQMSISEVATQDWMHKWKEGFEPFEVGERLIVVPSWRLEEILQMNPESDINSAEAISSGGPREKSGGLVIGDRVVIQVDPGMAFGTGTHETTRLCLEAIERHWRGGRLLDVGTGTGILAIAAAKLSPGSEITAIDVDPVAVQVARENVDINRVRDVRIREGQPRDVENQEFDMVVANLTAEIILLLGGELTGRVGAGGTVILSGILTELSSEVAEAINRSGLTMIEHREAAEWSLLVASRTA